MAEKRDYYEILGVPKTATEAEIKSAFRKQAKTCHPDLHPGDKAAEARFKELNEAAEVLGDPEKRAKYDQFGHAAFDPSMGGQNPSRIVKSLTNPDSRQENPACKGND